MEPFQLRSQPILPMAMASAHQWSQQAAPKQPVQLLKFFHFQQRQEMRTTLVPNLVPQIHLHFFIFPMIHSNYGIHHSCQDHGINDQKDLSTYEAEAFETLQKKTKGQSSKAKAKAKGKAQAKPKAKATVAKPKAKASVAIAKAAPKEAKGPEVQRFNVLDVFCCLCCTLCADGLCFLLPTHVNPLNLVKGLGWSR